VVAPVEGGLELEKTPLPVLEKKKEKKKEGKEKKTSFARFSDNKI